MRRYCCIMGVVSAIRGSLSQGRLPLIPAHVDAVALPGPERTDRQAPVAEGSRTGLHEDAEDVAQDWPWHPRQAPEEHDLVALAPRPLAHLGAGASHDEQAQRDEDDERDD